MSVIGQEAGIEHGTLKGYKQHRYRKVDACDPCLKASREYAQSNRNARKEAGPVERTDAQRAWYGGKFQHTKKTLVVPNPERAASLTVAAWSKDADECREFLTMLDLPTDVTA